MTPNLTALGYLTASVCFIMSLRGLSSPRTATSGIAYGITGMILAIGVTLCNSQIVNWHYLLATMLASLIVGAMIAKKTSMTSLPQLVAAFHSLVGLSAVFIGIAAYEDPNSFNIAINNLIHPISRLELSLGIAIGAITFSGSILAFGKLQGIITGSPLTFKGQHIINGLLGVVLVSLIAWFVHSQNDTIFWALIFLAFLVGLTFILPIGGADMPVVVSMLNSYSGWAAAGIGFTLNNHLLIITGAIVGSSGAILSYIMCKGMNRSLTNVLLGGFGGDPVSSTSKNSLTIETSHPVKSGNAEDAAFILENAKNIIIVPGYGMAVAQAQHSLREMAELLQAKGATVRYAIHPVAGRMPGHMNVLLAEANVPYDNVFELDEINRDFGSTDVAFVIGANDITNPAAKTDTSSPIYGMPILDVEKAGTVMFVKRSMAAGYAGVQNKIFFNDNTMMLFGDAKKICEQIVKAIEKGG